jgi:hypothetical protein
MECRLFCEAAEDTGETQWASQNSLFICPAIVFMVFRPGGHSLTFIDGIFVKSFLNSMGKMPRMRRTFMYNRFLLCYLRQKIGPVEIAIIGYSDEAVLFHAAVYHLYPPCWYIG